MGGRIIGTFACVALVATGQAGTSGRAAQAGRALENGTLRAAFSEGRLESLTDLRTGDSVRFERETFGVTIDGQAIDLSAAPSDTRSLQDRVTFTHKTAGATIAVEYELPPRAAFVTKRIRIERTGTTPYRVNDVRTLVAAIAPAPAGHLPLSDGNFGTLLRLPPRGGMEGSSLILLHQNPYNVLTLSGGQVAASYAPEMSWHPADGAFETDRLLVGLVRRSGRVIPARSVPEWTHVADYQQYLRDNPVIDESESGALVEMVRAHLLYRPTKSLRVHVPWCENDYQIDVATPDGWREYQRILDMAAQLGVNHTLFTPTNSALSSLAANRDAWGWENLLFFGLGQKIRTGEWAPGRDAVPQSLRAMIDAGRARGLKYVAYAYPSLPFLQDPAWTRWAGKDVGGYRGADTGHRGFQDWWVNTLTAFVNATGAAGFSFDHWWIAYDDPAATSKYAQWHGARRILEALRRRLPDVVIDGRQQYMNFGPWTWLAGSYPHPTLTDEQPESFVAFPDLHTDRVSANRQRFAAWKYRVERFTPPEIMPGYITHQTERSDAKNVMRRDRFRPRDWDVLGWKYSLFSSIGTAPLNHTVSFIPARDEDEFRALGAADKAFFRRWLDWTDTHAEVLKRLRPIIGPPMIGRVDGTAAIEGGRGFVFLFNPNYRPLDAVFRLDESIGLASGGPVVLKELHPEEGRLVGKPGAGIWNRGDEVRIPMRATEALVLEVAPASSAAARPRVFNVTGQARLSGTALMLTGVRGEPGTSRDVVVALARASAIRSLTVNGARVPFQQRGAVVSATVAFAGRPFGRGHSVVPYDPAFAGGRVSGSIVIPARVFAQLRARQAAWPVPYTEDDLRATWLGSHRLLLFVQIAEPNESLPVTLTIDGRPVELVRAYNSVYGHAPKRTFLGFYTDVSRLSPDVAHEVVLTLPALPPGRFQGMFLENVEPEWTTEVIANAMTASIPVAR